MPNPPPKKTGKARLTYTNDRDPVARKLIMRAIELATGRRRIEKLYHEIYDMDLQFTSGDDRDLGPPRDG